MSRLSLFNSPLVLGFDHFERVLDRVSRSAADGYPPYNVEQTGDTRLRITLAVAGFTMDDLQITQEDNQLVIRGRQQEETTQRIYLHRGIAARQFTRSFVLAEGIEVRGAEGRAASVRDDLVAAVAGQVPPALSAKTVHGNIPGRMVRAAGGHISLAASGSGVTVSAVFPNIESDSS